MKYLSFLLIFSIVHSMDPMEAGKRTRTRAEKYNLFIEVMRNLEREDMDIEYEPTMIYPATAAILGNSFVRVEEPNDYIMLDAKDFA